MAPNRRKAPPPAGEDVFPRLALRPSTPSSGTKTIYLITIHFNPCLVGLRLFFFGFTSLVRWHRRFLGYSLFFISRSSERSYYIIAHKTYRRKTGTHVLKYASPQAS